MRAKLESILVGLLVFSFSLQLRDIYHEHDATEWFVKHPRRLERQSGGRGLVGRINCIVGQRKSIQLKDSLIYSCVHV